MARLRTRRQWLAGILACASIGAVRAQAPAPPATRADAPGDPTRRHALNLPAADNLADDGATSAREHVPLLLFFDRGDCPYCDQALRRYLVPMSREEPWSTRVLFRQIEIDQDRPVVDFDGGATTHRALARRYRVRFTPTIVMVDGRGNAIAEPLIGVSPDFYAAYLEDRIGKAIAKMQ